jgi:hypothetical protein
MLLKVLHANRKHCLIKHTPLPCSTNFVNLMGLHRDTASQYQVQSQIIRGICIQIRALIIRGQELSFPLGKR